MTEHGASIFVFFFLGEYSSLILMSTFMSIFFLGGHHCPDLHKIIIDPLVFLYYFLESKIIDFLNYYIHYIDFSLLNSEFNATNI
jgi:NADH:ubiquinone oxidoreductase subunit H